MILKGCEIDFSLLKQFELVGIEMSGLLHGVIQGSSVIR